MNHLIKFPALLLVFLFSCKETANENTETAEGESSRISLTVKGSDTVLPLTQKLAEEFMKKNKEASITVTGGGSGVGIAALMDGNTEIGMASRDLKMDEKLKFKEKNLELEEIIVAYDALSIIVHPSNKIEKLTREQLEGIFTGAIKNWKEVGGDDLQIVPYSRESSSGTYEFFKEDVMNKKNYAPGILMLPATGGIVQSVSQTAGAIGYIGFAYQTDAVKPLSVSYDQGATFVEPSVENAESGKYPVSRPLFYLFPASNAAKVKDFIDFAMSEEGQAIVEEVGYIQVK